MTDLVSWARGLAGGPGRTAVLAVDGRSGAGKSTVARELAAALAAPVIQVEDLYPGWDGLRAGLDALRAEVLAPLAAGRPARWRTWDWTAGAYGRRWRTAPARSLVIVEGVGCGIPELAAYRAGLIWVELSDERRRERAMARDGDTYAPYWERWARQEDELFRDHDVREQADVIVDNTASLR